MVEAATPRGPYAPGERRKERLLEALLRLISREGLGAVSHRSVAAEAGIPAGSVTYYFPKRIDLVRGAFSDLARRQLDRIEALLLDDLDTLDVEAVAALATENVFRELDEDSAASARTEFELILAISRDPDLAPEYRAFQQRLADLQERGARALGSVNPERDGRIFQAFLRGVQLEALAAHPEARRDPDQIRSDLVRLLEALIEAST
ncbi:MAG: TetR family transcriptional regulator [Myxococcota bacterium]